MRSFPPIPLALAALLALGATACSDDVFTRGDAIARLERAGVPEVEAECVVEGVIDRLDLDVLNEERDPTASEQRVLDEVRSSCQDDSDGGS